MKTSIKKIPSESKFPPKWSCYFHAGDSWLEILQWFIDNKERVNGWSIFYVKPWIVSFCLELYSKSIVSYLDKDSNVRIYQHETSKLLSDFADKISLFSRILENGEIVSLIREYEKTVNTKYGETVMLIDGDDQNKLINLVYELREEACRLIGLK